MPQVHDIQSALHSHPEFIHVPPGELHQEWPRIRQGLEKVAKFGDAWIPEDVYTCIKAGTAYLHLIYDGEDYLGFVVTTPVQDYQGSTLHVWAIYSEGQNQAAHEAMFNQLDEWAMNINANRITFHTPRKGWERVGEKYGFKPTQVIFEKKVN